MRILLIEDDEILTAVLVKALEQQRYAVDTVDDGRFGLEYAEGGTYDLLLIDVGLPRLDGISLTQQLRNEGCKTPILLMTAQDAPEEKIRGLDAGADDYLTKPLDVAELQARLRALLRRGEVAAASALEVGPLRLDPSSCQVTYADQPLKLTPKEYSLLELFLRSPSRVFSRGQIVEHLWTFDDPPLEDSVKAHVKGLRRRLKQAGAKDWIENVYGLGYRLNPKVDAEEIDAEEIDAEELETDSVEQQFNQAMAQLWEQHGDAIATRLHHLQSASDALTQGILTPELSQSARQAAHKLAGVLGMFGKEVGTQLARALEATFSKEAVSALSSKTVATQLKQLTDIVNSPRTLDSAPSLSTTSTSSTSSLSSFPSLPPFSSPVHILAVDDDPLFLSSLAPMLIPWGATVTTLSDPAQFWQTLTISRPDLLILDLEMPGRSGIELCEQVRNAPDWQSLPILFITANASAAAQVFSAGADDYALKPILGPELIARIANRLERTRLLQRLSSQDAQTGLINQVQAQSELIQKIERGQPFTFVLLRLSNLARINLTYGHSFGHQVLKAWGDELTAHFHSQVHSQAGLPTGQVVSYWSNGDFVIGLPETTQSDAKALLSPVLKAFRQRVYTPSASVPSASNNEVTITRFQAQYKLGFSTFPEEGKAIVALYRVANENLTG
ncbi:MAG: response regulator [Phormidesmis sp.]